MRWQLTISYAGFLVVVGVVLFMVGFLVLRFVPEGSLYSSDGEFLPNRGDLTAVFVRYALVGIVGLGVIGLGGGWLLAGSMLRRLGRLSDTADRVRRGDLSHRVNLPGRADEVSRLADTFDDMLTRVESLAEEHRRFAASAAHELRTPHAVIRTMLEVARADPDRDTDRLLERISQTNERSIALTEALLSLAQLDGESLDRSDVPLGEAVRAAVSELALSAEQRGVIVDTEREHVVTYGNETLLVQLVVNLLQNAIVHNVPGGRVHVKVRRTPSGEALLEIDNDGAVMSADTVAQLLEPFARAAGRTRAAAIDHAGLGLGLSVAQSIVRAHRARLELAPRASGGLTASVTFPTS